MSLRRLGDEEECTGSRTRDETAATQQQIQEAAAAQLGQRLERVVTQQRGDSDGCGQTSGTGRCCGSTRTGGHLPQCLRARWMLRGAP